MTSASRGVFANTWLWLAIAGSTLLQVAVVQVPFLNDAFSTTPLRIGEWATCVGLASGVVVVAEVAKQLRGITRSW